MAKSPYAELPEPLKTYLPAMFASYPKLSMYTPSSWFTWTGEKVSAQNQMICHAQMHQHGSGWDEIITAVPNIDEVSLEYLKMLIRGPFRSMSDLIKLDKVNKHYYLHCLSLDKWPANVLMNFCIASRVPIEFKFLLSPWAKRCEAGFDPTLAFLLTYSYGANLFDHAPYDHRSFRMFHSNHMWLDPASKWRNILDGVIVSVSKPFKTHPESAIPANCIWGHCTDYEKLQIMSDEEIAEFYNKPIQILEPLPQPVPKKKAVLYGWNVDVEQLQANAFQQVFAAQQILYFNNNMAAQIMPDAPQPQVDEDIHDQEDPDEPPDEWFNDIVDPN